MLELITNMPIIIVSVRGCCLNGKMVRLIIGVIVIAKAVGSIPGPR